MAMPAQMKMAGSVKRPSSKPNPKKTKYIGPARERLGDGDAGADEDGRQREEAQQQRDQRQDLRHVQDGADEAPPVHLGFDPKPLESTTF